MDGQETARYISDLLGCECSNEEAIEIEQHLFSKLSEELKTAKVYQRTVDEMLVVAHIGIAKGEPKKEIMALVEYEISVRDYFANRKDEPCDLSL